MNKRIGIFLLVLVNFAAATHAAVEVDKLETSIAALKDYRYGNTNGVDLRWVEKEIGKASVDAAAAPKIERKLIETLSAATTNDAKQFLCRQLMTAGTDRSVPLLESMLADAEMSHMARYALGRIGTEKAGEAMRKALGRTSGKVKAGIINTLAQSDYARALADVMRCVGDPDSDVAIAAIRAVGYWPCNSTLALLKRTRADASDQIRIEIDNSLLKSAEVLLAAGDKARAAAIYEEFYSGDYPGHLRTAGLGGLVTSRGQDAARLLAEAIKADDPDMRRNAIGMMALMKGKRTTDTFVKLSRSVAPDARELIVRSLAARGDVSATPAVIEMIGDENENVRQAALEALGDIGTPAAVDHLAKAAATAGDRERQIARSSLVRINGDGIDRAIVRAIVTGDVSSRVEVIRVIGQRGNHEPLAVLLKLAKTDGDNGVRREAILSMGRIGKSTDLETLVQLLVTPASRGDRGAIEQAIATVFNKMEDTDAQATPVLSALRRAPDEAKVPLLNLLTRPATADALKAISAAVESSNSEVSDAAIRALGAWPNPAPVEQLYRIASGNATQVHKILALRGYIRLAPLTQDPTACYVNALKLSQRPDETRLVLGGLHHAGTLTALEIAESYMDDPSLKAEAYMAAAKVANVYCWQDRARAEAVLDKIIAQAPNDGIRNQARDVIRRMDEYKGIIATWKGTPPFTIPGVNEGGRVFGTVFEPEKDFDSEDIIWRIIIPEFEGDRRINLEKTYGGIDYCCAYLRTTIHSPKNQEARLKWSVDDYIKAWLNGEPAREGIIKLKKGANTFIVKVGDHGGGWSFRCEIVKPDDSPLEGLKLER